MKRFSSISDSVNKRGSFHLLPDYGTILPPTGQLFAIAGHKMKRREKIFGRSTIAIRNMLSGYRMRGFAREKPYSQFYPSPFTFSPETPINTGVVRGEGLAPPFTHSSPYHEVQPSLKTEAGHNRWLNMGSEMISHPSKRLRVYTLHN